MLNQFSALSHDIAISTTSQFLTRSSMQPYGQVAVNRLLTLHPPTSESVQNREKTNRTQSFYIFLDLNVTGSSLVYTDSRVSLNLATHRVVTGLPVFADKLKGAWMSQN